VAVALAYLWAAQPLYDVRLTLEPVRASGIRTSGIGALLGGEIGGDVGALVGSTNSSNTNLALALMRSDQFLAQFIATHALLPAISNGRWKPSARLVGGTPFSSWRAVERFRDDFLKVAENKRTGLVELTLRWPDPAQAKVILESLVLDVNENLRLHRVHQLDRSIAFLTSQLDSATSVELRHAIAGALQARLSEASLIGTREDFALAMVDPAAVPPTDEFASPRPLRTVLVGLLIGLLLGVSASLGAWSWNHRARSTQ
jgi:uncharacterized protein involved in exopolysaccharide biosynthesis